MALTSDFEFDVFLSHSSLDKIVVRDVAKRLQSDGLRVWFDEWEIRPGDSIPSKIEEGLERSRVLVFCMSANAYGSEWANLESQTFRFRDPLNRKRRFIPLRLDAAPIKGTLAQFLCIKWQRKDREFKTEIIRRQGPWRGLEDVEIATLEWVWWFNHRRLLEPIGYIPPVEYEENYHRPQRNRSHGEILN